MSVVHPPKVISENAFAPFGTLVRHDGSPERRHMNAAFEDMAVGTIPRLWTIHRAPPSGDVTMLQVERHPLSAQTFMPLGAAKFLVAVWPSNDDGTPDAAGARLFLLPPGYGLTYRRGVWHHGLINLDAPCDVAVLMGCKSEQEDTEYRQLAAPLRLRHDALF